MNELADRTNIFPLLRDFASAILEENPVHARFLQRSIADMSDEVRGDLIAYLEYCVRRGLSLKYLATCYNTIVNDTLGEEFFFLKHGRYRYSTFADVARNVYFDMEYMRKYMYGLALTASLWPNHARLSEFFTQTFPRGVGGRYLEVGPGHGYYFRRALELGSFDSVLGVDISPASVEMTRDILSDACISNDSAQVIEADFLSFEAAPESFSCIVMGEVLEHVERPTAFLDRIRDLSNALTHIFITTCINAPAVDHIYLFRSRAELEQLIISSGFTIAERCYAPYTGKTLEQSEQLNLSINVAYVVHKA